MNRVLITESGYLMLVKSFTDDLAVPVGFRTALFCGSREGLHLLPNA